ncbi:hypothetical protein MMC30_000106 [Trapelia coarctata]|nr:hypothetical protein [Trapelia coarctata]
MQCVERGLLHLDADVTDILHELKDMDLLTGFDPETGKPLLQKASNAMTLRMLLTHSSGMSYDVFNPVLQKYRAAMGQKVGSGVTIAEKHGCPLVYEPGTSWGYSPSIDWAGKMVERVNGDISLQDYMIQHIWEPLGIKDMIFHLRDREDLRKRMGDMSMRDPSGSGKAIYSPNHGGFPTNIQDAMGGSGVFASPREYFKVIRAVLANDGKLLKPESMEEFFQPHLSAASRQALMKLLEDPALNLLLGGMPLGTQVDWSLAGLLVMDDQPNFYNKGTVIWGGLPNLSWTVDRKAGLCSLYSSQIIPPGDPKSYEMTHSFQRAMYERVGGDKAR